MADFEQIARETRQRKDAIRAFLSRHRVRPFFGRSRWGGFIAVTPDLSRPTGWRVTRFDEAQQPTGHTEYQTYRKAVEEAVVWDKLDLSTVRFDDSRSAEKLYAGRCGCRHAKR